MDVNEVSIDYGESFDGWGDFAIDDITGAQLSLDLVRAARREEMHHMLSRTVKVVNTAETYEKTEKGPISTKWVDVDKSHSMGEMLIRSRWVARDFKEKGEKDQEDLFSATPPLELMRYMLSRQATIRDDGQERKTMYLDVKKAHLIPKRLRLGPSPTNAESCSFGSTVAVQLRRPGRSITRQCSVRLASRD